jgi:hypothetical protein
MAAGSTPQPDQSQGTPGAAPGGSPGQAQANPLQQVLGKLIQAVDQMSQQNPIVQQELSEAKTAFVKALQKTMLAGRPQQQGAPTPEQGQGQ